MNARSERFPSKLKLEPGDGVGYALGICLVALCFGLAFAVMAALAGSGSNFQVFQGSQMSPTGNIVGAGFIGGICLLVAGLCGWYCAFGWRQQYHDWHTAKIGGTEYPLSDPHNARVALALAAEPDAEISALAGNPNEPAVVFSHPQLTRDGTHVTVGPGTSVVAVSDEVVGADRDTIATWLAQFAA